MRALGNPADLRALWIGLQDTIDDPLLGCRLIDEMVDRLKDVDVLGADSLREALWDQHELWDREAGLDMGDSP